MAKDFSKVNTENIYSSAIEEATQEAPATQKTQDKKSTQKKQGAQKTRRTYDKQEAADFMSDLKTAGRKGLHLPRVNLAFTPEMYDYVRTMSKISGQTYTEFINKILQAHQAEHEAIYKQALKIRDSI